MIRLSLLLTMFASHALAQQQPAPSPEVAALQARVMQEINGSLQCSTAAIEFQREIAKLKAEIEAMKKPTK